MTMIQEKVKLLIQQLKLTYALLKDSRVPLWTKGIPALVVLYLLSPIDLIPEFIPVIGLFDDVAVLYYGLRAFEEMVPAYIVAEHRATLGYRK